MSDLIGGRPILFENSAFGGPHHLVVETWKQTGAMEDKLVVTLDLAHSARK